MVQKKYFLSGLITFYATAYVFADPVSATSSANSTTSTETLTCPTNFKADTLEDWRDKAISSVLKGNYNNVQTAMKECFSSEAPPGCMKQMEAYVDFKKNPDAAYKMHQTEYMGVPDSQLVEGPLLASEKDLPPEFLKKDKNGKVVEGYANFPPDILKLAKEKGWKAIGYKTRGTGGFDMAPNLSLVVIPGPQKDTYLQISPKPDKDVYRTVNEPYPESSDLSHGQGTMTIITVDKSKNPPVGQLRLLRYDQLAESYQWTKQTLATGAMAKCISCHTTPLRSISPRGYMTTNGDEKRMKPEDEETVSQINQMMLVEGLTWGKVKVGDQAYERGPDHDSQPYGWAPPGSETRSEDFIKQCANTSPRQTVRSLDYAYNFNVQQSHDLKDITPQKISQAMNCVQCHDTSVRGFLHGQFSFEEIKFKVLVDRSMPPGQDLSMDERISLVNCLRAEYAKVSTEWRKSGDWMKTNQCTDYKKPTTKSSSASSSKSGSSTTAPVHKTK